jgi:hypothetical protein
MNEAKAGPESSGGKTSEIGLDEVNLLYQNVVTKDGFLDPKKTK